MRTLKKGIMAALIVCSMLLSTIGIASAVETTNLTVGSPVFKNVADSVETVISASAAGYTKTEIKVQNPNSTEADATLIVALYKAGSNQISSMNYDTQKIAGGGTVTLGCGVNVPNLTEYSYKFYLWDSLSKLQPYDIPPTAPEMLSVKTSSDGTVNITWRATYNQTDVAGYIIYKDNTEIARVASTVTTYNDTGLAADGEHIYSVKAYNAKESISDGMTGTANITEAAYAALNHTTLQNKMTFLENDNNIEADSYTERVVYNDKECRKATIKQGATRTRVGMFYFRMDRDYVASTDTNVKIDVTYFDEGWGSIQIGYNDVAGDVCKNVTLTTRTDTKTWKTESVTLQDAKFVAPSALSYMDFRISGGENTWISNVAVTKIQSKEISDLYASSITARSLGVEWVVPTNTTGLENYTLFKNGEEIATLEGAKYNDFNLESDTAYTYSVKANYSDGSSTEVKTAELKTAKMLSSIIDSVPAVKNDGLIFTDNTTNVNSDSYTETAEIGGRSCRKSTTKLSTDGTRYRTGMFYFAVDRNAITAADTNVTVEVTYFDQGTAALGIRYNSTDASGLSAVSFPRTDTKTWKTACFKLTNAKFINSQPLTYNSFRIEGGVDTYIYKVSACRTSDYSAGTAVAPLDNINNIYNMNFKWGSAQGDTGETNTTEKYNMSGVECGKAPTGRYFEFDVDSNFVVASDNARIKADRNLDIEFTYFDGSFLDPQSDTINLEYNAVSGTSSVQVPATATDTWITKKISISDAMFANGIVGSKDFRIGTSGYSADGSKPLYLKDVKVSHKQYETVTSTLGEGAVYDGLKLFENTNNTQDSYTENAVKDGVNCRWAPMLVQSGANKNKIFYFDVDNYYMNGSKDGTATIYVTYYDEGTGNIEIHYNTASSNYQSVTMTARTNSMTWKTASVSIGNAVLANMQDAPAYADFRILNGNALGLYISSIKIVAGCTTGNRTVNATPTIFLAGDSTCSNYAANYAPQEGWGMEIGQYFNSGVKIVNGAYPGASTRTYKANNSFTNLMNQAFGGDYVFIQFGHNDSMMDSRHTDIGSVATDGTSYKVNLTEFVTAARAKGVIPVFLTSIRLGIYDTNGIIKADSIDPYRQEMCEVAATLNVPVVDVSTVHRALMNTWGFEGSKQFYLYFDSTQYPDYPYASGTTSLVDTTHTTGVGANEIAKIIINGIKTNTKLGKLAAHVDAAKDISAGLPAAQ